MKANLETKINDLQEQNWLDEQFNALHQMKKQV